MTNKDSKLIWEAFLVKEADNVTYKLGFFTGPHGGNWLPDNGEDDPGEVKWDRF